MIKVFQKELLRQKIVVVPTIYILIIQFFAVILGFSVLFFIYRVFLKITHHDH